MAVNADFSDKAEPVNARVRAGAEGQPDRRVEAACQRRRARFGVSRQRAELCGTSPTTPGPQRLRVPFQFRRATAPRRIGRQATAGAEGAGVRNPSPLLSSRISPLRAEGARSGCYADCSNSQTTVASAGISMDRSSLNRSPQPPTRRAAAMTICYAARRDRTLARHASASRMSSARVTGRALSPARARAMRRAAIVLCMHSGRK
jgi:hypothetical protein